MASPAVALQFIRMLTFNIWFDPHMMDARMQAIAKIVREQQPHIIALQEVTDAHWQSLSRHPAMGEYVWSEPRKSGYWTAIGSKLPQKSGFVRRSFPDSRMGRGLLYSVFNGPAGPIRFGTSHLESLDYAEARCDQLKIATEVLGVADNAIFTGDTNIDEEGLPGREPKISAPWQDAWLALGKKHEEGYTFDVETNSMVARYDSWAIENTARKRYDRFLVKLKDYEVESMEVVGTSAIGDHLFPSDHYGLVLTIVPKPAQTELDRHRD
eukprot:TRINITY_DN98058_c0_g1_i1.p1 TRINITY_DN98058_c0_g1~~TRINITY_DN98058_c0_g1_i1.p1  ORF type:complete len:268 (-),score=45.50 TRINITY_DN98058_c0_g1_i1:34-837(-)